jgi:hypothetical protein
MLGFITVPTNFVAVSGGYASTIINDLKIPITLLCGIFLAIWIIGLIIKWFKELAYGHKLYKAGEALHMTREEIDEARARVKFHKIVEQEKEDFDELLNED